MSTITEFANPHRLAESAANELVELASESIRSRGRFTLALAGGSTPRLLYRLLASGPYRKRVSWEDVDIFWGDERCVPPDHADSNYRMAREALLDHVPLPEDNIHRMQGEADPREAAQAYDQLLLDFFGSPPSGADSSGGETFDLTLLGMGSDGHTASLFPGTAALTVLDQWAVPNHVPQLGSWRLTLTVPAINSSRNIWFLVTGKDKADRLAEILAGTQGPEALPAQLIQAVFGRLRWLVDEAAAGRLDK